ncbi:MAG: hypothetical protein ACT4P2_05920 [Pseudomonadota bacterium]
MSDQPLHRDRFQGSVEVMASNPVLLRFLDRMAGLVGYRRLALPLAYGAMLLLKEGRRGPIYRPFAT